MTREKTVDLVMKAGGLSKGSDRSEPSRRSGSTPRRSGSTPRPDFGALPTEWAGGMTREKAVDLRDDFSQMNCGLLRRCAPRNSVTLGHFLF